MITRQDHLERDFPPQADLQAVIDDAHTSAAEFASDREPGNGWQYGVTQQGRYLTGLRGERTAQRGRQHRRRCDFAYVLGSGGISC